MGNLEGHVLAGMCLLIFALYYSVMVSLALLRGQRFLKPPLPPREKRGPRWWRPVPVEGMMKIAVALAGIMGEFFYPPGENRLMMVDWEDPRRPFVFCTRWYHITMYGFFMLSGVVDIVSQACQAQQNAKVERAAEALAFCVLVLLMACHVENKDPLEVRTHLLFVALTFLISLVLIIEVWVPDQPSLWVLKTWLGLALSNWMLQLGVLIYVPLSGQPWRAENPVDLAFLPLFFCWHLALAALVLAAIYGLCSLWHRRFSSQMEVPQAKYQLCPRSYSSEDLEKLGTEAMLQEGGI